MLGKVSLPGAGFNTPGILGILVYRMFRSLGAGPYLEPQQCFAQFMHPSYKLNHKHYVLEV